jgi:hypothetical protein
VTKLSEQAKELLAIQATGIIPVDLKKGLAGNFFLKSKEEFGEGEETKSEKKNKCPKKENLSRKIKINKPLHHKRILKQKKKKILKNNIIKLESVIYKIASPALSITTKESLHNTALHVEFRSNATLEGAAHIISGNVSFLVSIEQQKGKVKERVRLWVKIFSRRREHKIKGESL